MNNFSLKSYTALIPYVTILFGLHILKNAWIAILFYHAAILIVILRTNGFSIFNRLFCGWNWKVGLPLIVVSALSGLVLYYLWPLLSIQGQGAAEILREYGFRSGFSWQIYMIYYCVETPIVEEVFWRHYLIVPNRHPSAPDFLFAGYHVIVLILFLKPLPILTVLISLVLTAWVWRILALKYEGLAIPFLSHLIVGISVIWFANLLFKR